MTLGPSPDSPDRRSVSVVLPIHCQEDHIGSLVRGFHDALGDLAVAIEIVCVVNNSSDRSAEICREIASERAGIVVLEIPESGWGRAVRTGIDAATGDVIAYTNAARTTPRDLRTAVALALLDETLVVKALRRNRDSFFRRAGSVLYNFEARALFGLASWDLNGTPKVFPREHTQLLELGESGDLIDLEFLVACQRHGYAVIEYPVTSTTRHSGKSTTNLKSAVWMYLGAIRLRRRLGPWRSTE